MKEEETKMDENNLNLVENSIWLL